jgi:hypothetical protein
MDNGVRCDSFSNSIDELFLENTNDRLDNRLSGYLVNRRFSYREKSFIIIGMLVCI